MSVLVVNRQLECKNCGPVTSGLRRRTCSNGTFQVRQQCPQCGRSIGDPIPHYQVEDIFRLPAWDDGPEERQKSLLADLELVRREQRAEQDRAWWDQYTAHLASDQWRVTADKVLRRAGYTCEGCMEQRATQVHHLTYDHMGAEFLFELRALCRSCHERLHEKQL